MGKDVKTVGIRKDLKEEIEKVVSNPDCKFVSVKSFIDYYCTQGVKAENALLKEKKK